MTSMILGLVTVLGTVGFMVFMKKRLNTQYAHMRASEVATRLGISFLMTPNAVMASALSFETIISAFTAMAAALQTRRGPARAARPVATFT